MSSKWRLTLEHCPLFSTRRRGWNLRWRVYCTSLLAQPHKRVYWGRTSLRRSLRGLYNFAWGDIIHKRSVVLERFGLPRTPSATDWLWSSWLHLINICEGGWSRGIAISPGTKWGADALALFSYSIDETSLCKNAFLRVDIFLPHAISSGESTFSDSTCDGVSRRSNGAFPGLLWEYSSSKGLCPLFSR